jgi:hypothetical protein
MGTCAGIRNEGGEGGADQGCAQCLALGVSIGAKL